VSANYRLNGQSRLSRSYWTTHPLRDEAFGFLQGKEAKKAGLGNIGLRDRESAIVLKVFFPINSFVRTIRSPMGSKAH
jgi:hypothetical protein